MLSVAKHRRGWLQLWLQLAQIDLGSRSFAAVRQCCKPPAHQAFSDFGGRRRTPSGRPGSVGVRGSSPLSSTPSIRPFSISEGGLTRFWCQRGGHWGQSGAMQSTAHAPSAPLRPSRARA